MLNRSPTFSVQNMTPEEAWSRRQPSVDPFKNFGCIAYAHIPDEKRKKLVDKAEKCVFVGVSETSKAYKLFNPLTKKIVTSRDVIFDEDNTWDWNEQQPNSIIVDNEDVKELQLLVNIVLTSPNEAQIAPETEISTPTNAGTTDATTAAQSKCLRRRPAWMSDYKVTGIDQTEDPTTHFALFSDCDPTTFESAVKEEKWRKEMDDEIDAIERNDT